MHEDLRSGEAAAARLVQGVPLGEVLEVADPAAWTGLDLGVRTWGCYRMDILPDKAWVDGLGGAGGTRGTWADGRWASRWRPEPVDPSSVEALLAVALCHPDGRTREAALTRVADRPALLPLVVVRTADWAAPVRDRARDLLRAGLDARTGVALAPLILRIGRRDRGAYGVELLGAMLCRAPRGALSSLFLHPDRTVRRFAYRLAVEESLLSPARLARTAAWDDDVIVQELCAEAALAAVREDGDVDDVLEPLLAARNPRARSAGVTALRRAGRPGRALGFLADRSAVVRACARYVVRQHGTDPLLWYRQVCARAADPALPPGAAIGLAECGERADAETLRSLLSHPAPAVRARAVAGLRTLDVTVVEELRPLIDDPAPGVVREATLALLPSAALLPEAWLTERLSARRPRHIRVAALRLAKAGGRVVRLPVDAERGC
ncbi:HEAT repeat domain-containing protein [Streptomyces luteogriseus]|uniref:HEAT repeat domain-containing protein n=1 Tax=Streptomyces luteogriseus TaxID=68233 RepID=UPI0036CDFB36